MTQSMVLAERIATDLTSALRDAELMIEKFVSEGDSHQLSEVRAQAEAHNLYERRAGAVERAKAFTRVRVLAEAGLGALTFEEFPTLTITDYPEGIPIGSEVITAQTARTWRVLAVAHERGQLLPVLDRLLATVDAVGSKTVALSCSQLGVTGVPSKAVQKVIEQRLRETGLSKQELAESIGLPTSALYTPAKTMYWRNAKTIVDALNGQAAQLPMAPRKRRLVRGRHAWMKRQRKSTGGRWDETYSRFRRCLDEFASVAGEDVHWDDAYAHFYALEEIIGRAMKREGGVR